VRNKEAATDYRDRNITNLQLADSVVLDRLNQVIIQTFAKYCIDFTSILCYILELTNII